MNSQTKRPKQTDEIKELLASYKKLQKRIDNTEKRIECLEITMGAPSTPNYSGMPGGSRDNSSKMERDIIKKEELEEKLLALPGVLEALVSGEGETRDVKAEIYATVPEASVHRAVAALNRTLPVYQRVKTVVVRREPFPRTSSGKIRLG